MATNEQLERDVEQLQRKVSELITEHNLMSGYIAQFRTEMAKHLTYPWYRFIVWLWPLPLPPYARRVVVNPFHQVRRDRKPVVRDGSAPSRPRKPRLPAAETTVQ